MNASPITIRPIRPEDVTDCGRIIFEAFTALQQHHGFQPDFPNAEFATGVVTSMVENPSFFGVVAERDGNIVGSNFVDLRDPVAGIGPITVDPATQHSGAGRKLMIAVMDHARSVGAKSIRLVQEAFNTTSLSLYTSLGFDAKEPLALVSGKPNAESAADSDVRAMTEADLPACASLCRDIHGFERTNELRDALARKIPFVLSRNGNIVAYASSPGFWLINHGVAREPRDMFNLLLGAAKFTENNQLGLLLPMRHSEFFRWALRSGLRVQKPLTLMSAGEYHEPRGPFFPSVIY